MFDASCSFRRRGCYVKLTVKEFLLKKYIEWGFYVQFVIKGGGWFMYND